MTMWTGLIATMIIIAKSCMDVVGLEYDPKYQALTDVQFRWLTIALMTFALIVDIYNWRKVQWMKKYSRAN